MQTAIKQQVNERPILFSAPMVRAILDGRKTMTRRVMKRKFPHGEPEGNTTSLGGWPVHFPDGTWENEWCPYGFPGQRLWVRETFAEVGCIGWPIDKFEYQYRADFSEGKWLGYADMCFEKWKPSRFMPRAASRILLEITGVRVERLQDISEQDAIAEGVESFRPIPGDGDPETLFANYMNKRRFSYRTAYWSFASLWQSINGPESWEQNPWVWVVEFKRI